MGKTFNVPYKALLKGLEERHAGMTIFAIDVYPEGLQSRELPSDESIYRPLRQLEIPLRHPNGINEYFNNLIDAVRAGERVEFDGTHSYMKRPFFQLTYYVIGFPFCGFNHQETMSMIEEIVPKKLEGRLKIDENNYWISYRNSLSHHIGHFSIRSETPIEQRI